MPRSGAEARRRLQQAALELYREQGFDRTTTAEIAARAGVNERTFFRHFPDKREVLFDDGEAEFRAAVTEAMADVPDEADPLGVLLACLRRAGRLIEANRAVAEPRSHVIAATPALRERDLMKGAMLADFLAAGLRARGVDPRVATLSADVGWAAFHRAVTDFLGDPSSSLETYLAQAFEDLRTLASREP